jgi:hypothetical protein
MPETPPGFSLEETKEGYILRHGGTEIRMRPEEFDQLKALVQLWQDRRLSQYRVVGNEARPIVVHPVAEAVLFPDLMGNVLLNAVTQSSHITLLLPPPVAMKLAKDFPTVLAMIANPTKQ